jgi:porin
VYTGLLPGRDEDVAGFAVSAGFNGGRFKRAQRLAGTPVDDMEMALEWTYQMKLLPWLSLQLDAQFIKNPGTDRAVNDALVFGLRYKVTF